jgi:DNA-binding NtrC family response regulator
MGRAGAGAETSLAAIVGVSEVMRQAIARAERFAASGLPVLIIGATGTGKELFARHIHRLSGRRGEFVDVNCGALPRDMVESLLFGHRRGAFTGAVVDMPGLVTNAGGGTLFLDELCSLGVDAQVKLLRVLENGEVRALGDTRNASIDFRLVAAVQEQLGARLENGSFREDLYHRIAGVILHLPRLAQRPEDISVLAAHFASRHGRILGRGAVALMERHSWPGNVRELRAVIDRAALLTDESELDATALTDALSQGNLGSTGAVGSNSGSRRIALLAACAANSWHPGRIASTLGISRATLYRRLKTEGISLRSLGRRLSHQSQFSQSG